MNLLVQSWNGPREANREQMVQLGVWIFLSTVAMLFAAFTSAYIIRRTSGDWRSITLPPVLGFNTIVILLSSVVADLGRRAVNRNDWSTAQNGFGAAFALGMIFLGGQYIGWQHLMSYGYFVATLPGSSFFYILTGVHAVHLLAGLTVLLVTLTTLRPMESSKYSVSAATRARVAANFWHFLAALWLYLYALLALF